MGEKTTPKGCIKGTAEIKRVETKDTFD